MKKRGLSLGGWAQSWARLWSLWPWRDAGPDLPMCLQALPYVCLLIAMLFFIYAIIGMQVGAACPNRAGCRALVQLGHWECVMVLEQ